MLEGYIKGVSDYTPEELVRLTAAIDAEMHEQSIPIPSFYLIGRYPVTFRRERRNYFLEVYKTEDGAIWWSVGNNRHPVLCANTNNINKRSVDFMLLDSMLHTSAKRGTPIEASPASAITNYLDLVKRILSDTRVH